MTIRSYRTRAATFIVTTATLLAAHSANAELIGGVEFPEGAVSFADAVVDYAVGSGGATAPHTVAANALGVPDYAGDNNCTGNPTCSFVSLGSGGTLILRFTDNVLTGSDNDDFDLWIFEVGPDVENTFVAVSEDGAIWESVGFVTGATRGIDIDASGFGSSSAFAFVRLIDDATEGSSSGITVGADIDAVGAISTRPVVTPAPGLLASFALGLLATVVARRSRRRPI